MVRPFLKREAPPVKPDVLLHGETSLEEFGIRTRVIETPGHTAGSVSVVLPGSEIIAGDVMAGGYLRFKLKPHKPRYHLYAEDLGQVRESIEKILDLSSRATYGGPLDPGAVRKQFFVGV